MYEKDIINSLYNIGMCYYSHCSGYSIKIGFGRHKVGNF